MATLLALLVQTECIVGAGRVGQTGVEIAQHLLFTTGVVLVTGAQGTFDRIAEVHDWLTARHQQRRFGRGQRARNGQGTSRKQVAQHGRVALQWHGIHLHGANAQRVRAIGESGNGVGVARYQRVMHTREGGVCGRSHRWRCALAG